MMLMCKHASLSRQSPHKDANIDSALLLFDKKFWCRFLGKARFLSGDCTHAEASYREALGLQRDTLPAWKGLAEVYSSIGSTAADARETFEQLVRISPKPWPCSRVWLQSVVGQMLIQTEVAAVLQLEISSESEDRRAAYKESLAKCYFAESRPVEALLLLKQLPEASRNRPENLALTADAQVRIEEHA